MSRYEDYKAFINKYKNEPRQGSDDYDEARIARWASFNRQLYHGGIKTNKPLTQKQIKLLNNISFSFEFLKPQKDNYLSKNTLNKIRKNFGLDKKDQPENNNEDNFDVKRKKVVVRLSGKFKK